MEHNAPAAFQGSQEYIASRELIDAVEIAMALEKPLLIKGEPGTGKTMLAQSIADSLGKRLIIWNIKSTTKAQEGLYTYDVVRRLYDSQLGNLAGDIGAYIQMGMLGEAFQAEEQAVLLIDEIDKADLEFPNDLLWELDRMEFAVTETKEIVKARYRPVVIITSNAEKELPDAFLRRCIFHYIEFPGPEMMERIVRAHLPDLEARLLREAMEAFYALRDLPAIRKRPGTSELLDWLQALALAGIPREAIKARLPFAGVLLKTTEDLQLLEESLQKDGGIGVV